MLRPAIRPAPITAPAATGASAVLGHTSGISAAVDAGRAHARGILGQEVRQRVQERLHARDHAHAAKVLIALDGQVGLVAHLLGEELVHHGVRPAPVVGQVHGKEARVAADQLRARDDVLPERPTDARMVGRDVDVVAPAQVRERDDLLPMVEQDLRNAHVERAVGDAVVTRDDNEDALVRGKRRQELVAQPLQLLPVLGDGEAPCHHRDGGFLRRVTKLLTQTEHSPGHGLLPEVHVEQGT